MWSSYRKCTGCTSFCNIFLGIVLIILWTTCYFWCLSRMNSESDLAAPLWVGVVSVLVGSFGLLSSCLYWKRKYETLLYVLTLITTLCSGAALVLSVHAAYKENLLYQSQGRPLEGLGDGVLGVALFGVMAALSFALFLTSVTWACTCFFKRLKGKRQDDEDYDLDDVDAMIWEYQKAVGFGPARSSSTGTRPSGSRRNFSSSSNLASENETETPGRSAQFSVPSYSARQGNAGTAQRREDGGDDAASASTRTASVGPRFASVTAAELRWWDYYSPPKEKAGFGGF
ncbi:uncharacterized protein LOC119725857 [Patiria miniata]|uniref:Uncharacterized protein n=1 Tax=Patiria miniata TaxID=46514 RepID=A0A913ZNR9_PATMI|nr:uncharacterized protein LOC119725857 [Patiria miniata]